MDTDTERCLLGALANQSLTEIREAQRILGQAGLTPEHFANPGHGAVFGACAVLVTQGSPLDPESVWTRLEGNEDVEAAGGKEWLTELMSGQLDVPPGAIPQYVSTLKDRTLRRAVRKQLQQAMHDITDPGKDSSETLVDVTANLARVTRTTRSFRSLEAVYEDVDQDLEAIEKGAVVRVLRTGIVDLDSVIGGLQRGICTAIGADTGVGKSAFLSGIAEYSARHGVKVGVFSLEDSATWLAWRFLARRSGLTQHELKFQKKTAHQAKAIADGKGQVGAYSKNIFIDDRPMLKAEEIVLTARDLIVNHGVGLLIIDHMGEVDVGTAKDRHDLKVAAAFSLFRDLAKTHDIPVVVASQVTIDKQTPMGTPPKLTEFRNSREIANKCRVALGLGRKPNSPVMTINVLKQTNGPAGQSIDVEFVGNAAMVRTSE